MLRAQRNRQPSKEPHGGVPSARMLRCLRGGVRGLATKSKGPPEGRHVPRKLAPPQDFKSHRDSSRMPALIGAVDSWMPRFRSGPGSGSELQTVGDVFRYAITEFSREAHALVYGQGSVDAMDEAHLLLLMHLNAPLSSAATFMKHWGRARLTGPEVNALRALIFKRVYDKVPVAYLCKGCYQQGEKLFVDERCLIPRSHIGELLAPNSRFFLFKELPLRRNMPNPRRRLQPAPADRPAAGLKSDVDPPLALGDVHAVLDLCTGSGALAILAYRMLALARPPDRNGRGSGGERDVELVIHAADISTAALEVARVNLHEKRLTAAISLFCGDLWAALPAGAPLYDLVLCNPPYVDDVSMATLPTEYRQEPELALRGGPSGLALIGRIVEGAARRLTPVGRLVLEVGASGRRLREAVAASGGQWWRTSNSEGEVLVLGRSEAAALAEKLCGEAKPVELNPAHIARQVCKAH